MKFKLLLIIPAICFGQVGFNPVQPERVICSACHDSGFVSIVTPGGVTCTLMFCGNGYYDTLGYFHAPVQCNTCTRYYHCSHGHDFSRCINCSDSAAE
jgi:hypothetical protein